MKNRFMSAKEFRKNIFKTLDDVEQNLTQYVLTKNGEPKAIVMNIDEVEALMETSDILSDPNLMKQIRNYRRKKGGKFLDWETVKRNLT